MLICSCKWLTYKQIRSVIEDGARSVEDIQRRCGAGTECGSCVDALQHMVSTSSTPQDAEDLATPPDVDSSAA